VAIGHGYGAMIAVQSSLCSLSIRRQPITGITRHG
jgi:hypothetical protein